MFSKRSIVGAVAGTLMLPAALFAQGGGAVNSGAMPLQLAFLL
jgi:hypothetical protein